MVGKAVLLNAVGSAQSGPAVPLTAGRKVIQGTVTGTGSVSAVISIKVRADSVNWLVLATITLSGTTTATDGFETPANWPEWQAELISISGTNAAASVTAGV